MAPDYLKQGDTIGIVAPSRKISAAELRPAVDFFTEQGFKVLLGEHIFSENNQFAGTEAERAADMQAMLDNPQVKAILAARGGYGAVRVIDRLDFRSFCQSPKWLCGYSDFTVFHEHVHACFNVPTLHSTMPVNMQAMDGVALKNAMEMVAALKGETLRVETQPHCLNRAGDARAEIVGGNLSMLYSLTGSKSDICTEGKILFIEDLDEYLYHIDRMMMNLKRNGKLEKLAALVVGGLSDMHDNTVPYGKTAEEIVSEHCAEYDYPICFNFPAGHIKQNLPMRFGMTMDLHFNAAENNFVAVQVG